MRTADNGLARAEDLARAEAENREWPWNKASCFEKREFPRFWRRHWTFVLRISEDGRAGLITIAEDGAPGLRVFSATTVDGYFPLRFDEVFRAELEAILSARPVKDPGERQLTEGISDSVAQVVWRPGLVGLALSGGGVRSATFNLGLVQSLCERGLLSVFDYMSMVSGGGYVGTLVQSLVARATDLKEVERKLSPNPDSPEQREVRHLREHSSYLTPRMGVLSLDTWNLIVAYLRGLAVNVATLVFVMAAALLLVYVQFAAFAWIVAAAPKSDGWLAYAASMTMLVGFSFVAVMLFSEPPVQGDRARHLFRRIITVITVYSFALSAWLWSVELWIVPTPDLWLIVFLGVFFGFTLVGIWLANPRSLHFRDFLWIWLSSALTLVLILLAVRAFLLLVKPLEPNGMAIMASLGPAALLATLTAALAIYSIFAGPLLTDLQQEKISAFCGMLARLSACMLAAVALVLYGPLLIMRGEGVLTREGLVVAVSWALTTGGALWASGRELDDSNRLLRWLAPPLLKVAPWVFITGLLVLIAAVMNHTLCRWLGGVAPFFKTTPTTLLVVVSGAAVCLSTVAVFLAYTAGVNQGSMQTVYRNRLVRAYLGAARVDMRKASVLTGFDDADDLPLSQLKIRPLAIYNAALSLLSEPSLASQYRKARPFTLTPLHCGFECEPTDPQERQAAQRLSSKLHLREPTVSSFRLAHRYGGGLTVGDAMAISGAAVTPSLGSRSSAALSFLLTLFNLRMGVWLPNPRNQRSWAEPRHRIGSLFLLVRELLGRTNDRAPAIYVSDGGHFENLGLYELVRRRCRFILASDASEDRSQAFDSLAGAVERIRVDFGVDIEIDISGLRSDQPGRGAHHVAVGKIVYDRRQPDSSVGVLVYVRAVLTGDEPADVLSYAHTHADFPNETTADQWFDELQFEAYRALGLHTGRRLCGALGADADPWNAEHVFGALSSTGSVSAAGRA